MHEALLKYVGKTKKYALISVVFLSLRHLSLAGIALLFGYLLETVLLGTSAALSTGGMLLGILFLILLRSLSAYFGTVSQARVVAEVKQNLRTKLIDKLFQMGNRYLSFASTANIINMGTDTIEQLENYYGRYLSELYTTLTTSVLLFILLALMNYRIALTFLIFAPLVPLFILGMLKMVKKMQSKYWRKYQDVGQLFLDSLQGITTLKIFNADDKRAGELTERSEQFRLETMKILKMQLTSITLIEWLAYGGGLAVILTGLHEWSAGRLAAWQLLGLLILAFEAFRPMITLTSSFHVAMTGIAASEKLLAFLALDIPKHPGTEPIRESRDIILDRLDYRYPDAAENVLSEVSAVIETAPQQPGYTAIVGPSGSGKSTLAKIISSELWVNDDSILYGDRSYRALASDQLATRITRVGHDVHLFEGTVRENLAMATDDEAAMIRVLQDVKLWEEIKERGGLDLPLTQHAENLSGGQRQRLAIARALLNDSSVYIFDEATSNIDIESETIILELIEKLALTRQVIVISHRLRSIQSAKKILVLENGRLAEAGDHSSLMAARGLYFEMYRAQEVMEQGQGEVSDDEA